MMGVGNEETGIIGVVVLLISVLMVSGLAVTAAHGDSCGHALDDHSHHHHQHQHQHHQCGGHDHHHVGHVGLEKQKVTERMLPEELAEEEDLKLYGLGDEHQHHRYDHYHDHGAAVDAELTGIGKVP